LVKAFKSLGVVDAFDTTKANFSAIATKYNGLIITDIVHQANINVDESGAQASAATVVSMAGGAWHELIVEFHCNRPFMFVIHDTIFYNAFFIGKYTGPSSS
jgi:serpin B